MLILNYNITKIRKSYRLKGIAKKLWRKAGLPLAFVAALYGGISLTGCPVPTVPDIPEQKKSSLDSLVLDKSTYVDGDVATATLTGYSYGTGDVEIDIDRDGPLPKQMFRVTAGDFSVNCSGVVKEGNYTPWAKFYPQDLPDALTISGKPYTVTPPGVNPPSFDIKYNSETGPTDIDEKLFNGYTFDAYLMGEDDALLKSYQVKDPQTSEWIDLENGMILDYGNGDTAEVFRIVSEQPYFLLRFNLNSTGSNRNFDIIARVVDLRDQIASDIMGVSVLENIMEIKVYDKNGVEKSEEGTYTDPIVEAHNMDAAYELEFRPNPQTYADTVAVFEDNLFVENISPSVSYFRNLDFTGSKHFTFQFWKGSANLKTIDLFVDSTDSNPDTPVIYEWDVQNGIWVQCDGQIGVSQGIQLRYRIKLSDENNDALDLVDIVDGEWPYQLTTDKTVPNEGDVCVMNVLSDGSTEVNTQAYLSGYKIRAPVTTGMIELRLNTLNRRRGPPYVMRNSSIQTQNEPLESSYVDTDVGVY